PAGGRRAGGGPRAGGGAAGGARGLGAPGGGGWGGPPPAPPRQSGTDPPTAVGGVTVTASSQFAGDPLVAPRLALDGDPRTAWVSGAPDLGPRLMLRWPGRRTIDRLRLGFAPPSVASRPYEVIVKAGGVVRQA